MERQRDALNVSILTARMERPKYTKEEIVQWISRYKVGNINDKDYQKEIIDTFLNSIYVYDDRLVFTYNYKDGTETLTLQEVEAAFSSDLKDLAPPKQTVTPEGWPFCFAGGYFDEGFGSISEAPKRQAERRLFGQAELMHASEASRSLVSSTIRTTL